MTETPTISTRLALPLIGGLALGIWLMDTSWIDLSPDVVVILSLLPITWLVAKREPAEGPSEQSAWPQCVQWFFVVLLLFGIVFNSMTAMAWGWGGLAVQWVFPASRISPLRLLVLSAGAFPWILLDHNTVGWLFRLSGASMTATLFEWLGMNVVANGTQLVVSSMPMSVEAACGGLQLLQVLLSGGSLLTLLHFPVSRGFWWMLASLPLLAWATNTLRIIVITVWGLSFGMESAAGAFHTWGALLVLASMLLAFLFVSQVLKRIFSNPEHDAR